MVCRRCGRENEEGERFCARCGIELSTLGPAPEPQPDDAVPCTRHPRRKTRLACGKCLRPYCDQCLLHTPAGLRCRECVPKDIGWRPGVVGLGIKRFFREAWSSPYRLWILVLLVSATSGLLRTCAHLRGQPREEPSPVESTVEENS